MDNFLAKKVSLTETKGKHQLQHTSFVFPIGQFIKTTDFQVLFQSGILSGFQ